MKRNFFKKLKRKCNKELKLYYKKMNILYELFNNFYIADCEDEIFIFIKSMSRYEIEKMFDDIILYFDNYDMAEAIYEPIILKSAIMVYIQKMRNEEIDGN
jgi:hypothetical protein